MKCGLTSKGVSVTFTKALCERSEISSNYFFWNCSLGDSHFLCLISRLKTTVHASWEALNLQSIVLACCSLYCYLYSNQGNRSELTPRGGLRWYKTLTSTEGNKVVSDTLFALSYVYGGLKHILWAIRKIYMFVLGSAVPKLIANVGLSIDFLISKMEVIIIFCC